MPYFKNALALTYLNSAKVLNPFLVNSLPGTKILLQYLQVCVCVEVIFRVTGRLVNPCPLHLWHRAVKNSRAARWCFILRVCGNGWRAPALLPHFYV